MGLTHQRDLRTGRAVWSAYPHHRVDFARLERSTRAEVVVIGAGITGALVSHALTQAGIRPLVLDRRDGARLGSTAASTALLQFELDTPLNKLSGMIGRRRAEQAWKCSHAAVNELKTQTRQLNIPARLHTRPSLYLAGDVLDAKGLAREVKSRQRVGFPSEYLERAKLRHHFGIDRDAAILSHGNAEADPVALAEGFLQVALRAGARFYGPHDVADIHAGKRGVTLVTRDAIEIHARRVIFCTGYELPRIVPRDGHQIYSTWAMATAPQPTRLWPEHALIWESSDPYLYLRATHDGRVICGGEDEEYGDSTKRDARIAAKTARLEKKLGRLLPQIDSRAQFAWAGCFGGTKTGLPLIGGIPGHRGCYAALGYGGNGITFSMLAATLLRNLVLGKTDPDLSLFAFG